MAKRNMVGKDLDIGDCVSVTTGNLILSCTVVRITDKAIQVGHEGTNIKVWFPKSALSIEQVCGDDYSVCSDFTRYYRVTLAAWFNGDVWFDKFCRAGYVVTGGAVYNV